MSYQVHRDTDPRACGAATTVENQTSVYVNNKLWAVKGSTNSHIAGGLINTTGAAASAGNEVYIENIEVIVHGPDLAEADELGHVATEDQTAGGSDDVEAY